MRNINPCDAVSRLIVALAAFFLLSLLASARADSGQSGLIFPLGPTDLLALLPQAPENWKMTASAGEKRLSPSIAPEAYARRDFLYVPPAIPGEAAPAQPPPPKTVRVTLMDTGNDPDRMSLFEGFKASKDPVTSNGGEYLNFLADGLPATRFHKDKLTFITVEVSNRFLLTVQMTNVEDKTRDEWLKILDLPKLAQASAQAPALPLTSGMLTLESIDEFKPETNSKTQTNLVTEADRARFAKTQR